MGGFMVKLFKDRFTEEQLQKLGLNDRQMKAVEYVKTKGKITNAEYQEINNVSKRTATNDLSELVEQYKLLNNKGFGAGSYYELIIGQIGQRMGNNGALRAITVQNKKISS